jgi:prophage regulatory protein
MQPGVVEKLKSTIFSALNREVNDPDMPTRPQEVSMSGNRLIRLPEALRKTGYTRSTWYRMMGRDPFFPQPIKLSERCVAFREADVDALVERLAPTTATAK